MSKEKGEKMAKRRMLSIDFCESDGFYMLSPTARMLYVHFILNADDDGFVDKWRTIMRCARIEGKHYRVLKDGGYIIEINDRLIVVTDWHRHNTIRADRYIATAYAKELQGLRLDENKRYFKASEDFLVANCVPQSRIDKNREDKISTDETRREEEKNKNTTTILHSYIQDSMASPSESAKQHKDSLSLLSLNTLIKLYFMKNYRVSDMDGFVEFYEKRGWVGDMGEISASNYKAYIDEWMSQRGRVK